MSKQYKDISGWKFEDILYLCWAWEKNMISEWEIAFTIGKTVYRCNEKVKELKSKGLFELYKEKYETGNYISSGV